MISPGSGTGGQPLYDRLWGSGFLPSRYQGVKFRSVGDPVLYLSNPSGFEASDRRIFLDSLAKLDRIRLEPAEHQPHQRPKRMPGHRPVVVHDDHLAAGTHHAQGLREGGAAHRFRLLVQQEEQQHLVVAGIVAGDGGRVAVQEREMKKCRRSRSIPCPTRRTMC